jgi:hypothetical protein
VQAGPPTARASFQITLVSAGIVSPSFVHSGLSTRVSRGIETAYADFRPSATWSSIVRSEPPPPASPSIPQPSQARVSVPSTRMLTEDVGSNGSGRDEGRAIGSPTSMLLLTWL